MEQTTVFDFIEEDKFRITKPIRLIELFSGYGSQALALKYSNIPFEHWKTCEWAIKSIQAYKDIHFTNEDIEILIGKEEMVNFLFNKGISSNYNEPMSRKQIERLSEDKLETIIKNILITNNMVNIQQVKGRDLQIEDTEHFTYLLTYSFPCQDLSLAGKGKGMHDTSTRSGMLWEVERILTECHELGSLPQVLLMENVPQVHGKKNLVDFNKWQDRLKELGYTNYWQDLIATDYGIPQIRNRTFMISILGDYNYTFPKPIPLASKLNDLLENEVDNSYYLSEKMIDYIISNDDKYKVNENKLQINRDIVCCKTTREGNTRADASDYISKDVGENYNLKFHKSLKQTIEQNEIKDGVNFIDAYNKNIDNSGLSKTITTRIDASNNTYIAIKNNNKKGFLPAMYGDGIDISSRMEHHRGTVQKGMIQTIDCKGGESKGVLTSDLRIRKLTPKECFRLMGVKDEDFENCAKNQSNASLYHLAGDSIVVNVLMAIFKEMI